MRILLLGASGFVGRRVLPLLLARGDHVTIARRAGSTRSVPTPAGVTPIRLDMFDRAAASAAMRDHDAVINLATRIPTGSVKPFLPGAWKENDRIRREGSRALTLAAHDAAVPRFIQESFAPVYEAAGASWITESSSTRPARYNRSVLDAERSVAEFARDGGAGVALRFALFHGGLEDDFTKTLLHGVHKGWLPMFGAPDAFLSMVHHADAATAVIAALGAPAGIYNVAEDEPLTRREIGDALAARLGVKPPKLLPPWMSTMAGSVGEMLSRSLRISHAALTEVSGWQPRHHIRRSS